MFIQLIYSFSLILNTYGSLLHTTIWNIEHIQWYLTEGDVTFHNKETTSKKGVSKATLKGKNGNFVRKHANRYKNDRNQII